ncbi:hypothetical protein PG993_001372 [Apiospora rasikravindrae]|uniref:Uncharacterized protein n=1 Tax=Apiospora rasikravindrae TaxID=990691 RepID=A0ABR1UB84_9PEZI
MGDENHWVLDLLEGVGLPESTIQLLQDNVLHPETPFQIFGRSVWQRTQQAFQMAVPVVQPMVNRALTALNDSPDIVIVGAVLVFIVAALQFLFWVQRVVLFWTRMTMRLIFYAVLAGALAVVWQRGPEAAIRDIVIFVSKIAGYATLLKNFWLSEYERYDAQTKNGRGMGAAAGMSRRGGR